MTLIRILGKDGLTGLFYVRGADSKKAVLLISLKTKWLFLATLRSNLVKYGFN